MTNNAAGISKKDIVKEETIFKHLSSATRTMDLMDELDNKRHLIFTRYIGSHNTYRYYSLIIGKNNTRYSDVRKGLTMTALKKYASRSGTIYTDFGETADKLKDRDPKDPMIPLMEQLAQIDKVEKEDGVIPFYEPVELLAQKTDRNDGFRDPYSAKKYGETYSYSIIGVIVGSTINDFYPDSFYD